MQQYFKLLSQVQAKHLAVSISASICLLACNNGATSATNQSANSPQLNTVLDTKVTYKTLLKVNNISVDICNLTELSEDTDYTVPGNIVFANEKKVNPGQCLRVYDGASNYGWKCSAGTSGIYNSCNWYQDSGFNDKNILFYPQYPAKILPIYLEGGNKDKAFNLNLYNKVISHYLTANNVYKLGYKHEIGLRNGINLPPNWTIGVKYSLGRGRPDCLLSWVSTSLSEPTPDQALHIEYDVLNYQQGEYWQGIGYGTLNQMEQELKKAKHNLAATFMLYSYKPKDIPFCNGYPIAEPWSHKCSVTSLKLDPLALTTISAVACWAVDDRLVFNYNFNLRQCVDALADVNSQGRLFCSKGKIN